MSRKNITRYTTGQFAKYFGIKKDTLFYYDKIKLFCPAETGENGYRYYTSSQLDTFWALLSLRELHMPIQELQLYFKYPTPEKLQKLAAVQAEKITAELDKLNKIRTLLLEIESACLEASQAALECVMIKKLPARRLIYSQINQNPGTTSGEDWVTAYNDFLVEKGFDEMAHIGSIISRKDLLQKRFGRVEKLFTVSHGRKGQLLPSGDYAVFYHKGNYNSLNEVYPYLLKTLLQMGLTPCSDAYEDYLVGELATKNEEEYITRISIQCTNISADV